jgi:hypothetical protein
MSLVSTDIKENNGENNNLVEQWFNENIETFHVSKEEFLAILKKRNPEIADEDILQGKAEAFDYDGKVVILIRNDIFPDAYLPYVETHEKWEAYIARKQGFNLFKKSVHDYQRDKEVDIKTSQDWENFLAELNVYNYDYRHEYAIYKEYKHAQSNGKLGEYHQWFMKLREEEMKTAKSHNLELIANDTRIRQSIFDKITYGNKHEFTRN